MEDNGEFFTPPTLRDIVSVACDMGGTNISYQNLKTAYSGISEAKKVEYKNLDGEYGHFNASEDPNKVILSDALLGKGKEASAMLATVMSHEGTHVYGNRVEGVAHLAGLQTYSQLGEMLKLKGNKDFTESMENALNDEKSWKENTGDVDYWKLVKQENGKYGLEYDGFHSLYDENGNLLIRNEIDEFDEDGNNLGAWALKNRDYTSFKSYAASLGMLLGTYTNYMNDKDAYELNWSKNGNNDLRKTTERLLRETYGTSNLTLIKDSDSVIDANPFLMTLIGIKTGVGTQTTYVPQIYSIFQTVNIYDEYNNVV